MITPANNVVGKILLEGVEYFKNTQMRDCDITKLTAELKSNNIQCTNKIIYNFVVVFWWRRSIAAGSTALILYLICWAYIRKLPGAS